MGDKNPIKLTGVDFTVVEMAEIECTDESVFDKSWLTKLNEPAEFSCEISLPPRALIKLLGWKWYFKWHFNRVLNKIRKILGVRSPTLPRYCYYSCCNCAHHVDQASDFEDVSVYCRRRHAYMHRWDTCRKAKPIEIKPLKLKHDGRGLRAKCHIIDEWCGGKDDGAHT